MLQSVPNLVLMPCMTLFIGVSMKMHSQLLHAVATNKAIPVLIEFVCECLTLSAPPALAADQSIILAKGFKDGQIVKVVMHTGVQELPELFSTQEEADTRLLLHAIHLAKSHKRIILRCDNTDVLVLLIYFCSRGMFNSCEVYMHAGDCNNTINQQRFIPVSSITSSIGKEVSLCLPAAHALSGCDSTSSLFRIGEFTAYITTNS